LGHETENNPIYAANASAAEIPFTAGREAAAKGFAGQPQVGSSLNKKILKKLPNHPEKLKKSLVQNPITCLYLPIIAVKWFC
jgi:hypothetical protein